MTFGERLRELREEKNMTQKSLALLMNISPRMISFYESGAHFLRDEQQLIFLANYFDTTIDYLLGYSDARNEKQFQKLSRAFEILPEEGRRSILEYTDFLCAKYRKPIP